MFVHQQHGRLDRGFRESKRHDGHTLAGLDPVGGSAVDEDFPGAGCTLQHIGFQTGAGGDRGDQHFLPRPQIRRLHQVGWDFDAAFVIDIRVSDHGAVEFGLDDLPEHAPEETPAAPPRQAARCLIQRFGRIAQMMRNCSDSGCRTRFPLVGVLPSAERRADQPRKCHGIR